MGLEYDGPLWLSVCDRITSSVLFKQSAQSSVTLSDIYLLHGKRDPDHTTEPIVMPLTRSLQKSNIWSMWWLEFFILILEKNYLIFCKKNLFFLNKSIIFFQKAKLKIPAATYSGYCSFVDSWWVALQSVQ